MKITIQTMAPPYTCQDLDTALNIAEAALNRGHEVRLFLFSDAVLAANADVKPVRIDRNIPARMKSLIADKGLRVDICGICMEYRGLLRDHIVAGSAPSGLPELAELVVSSDRFINLMA